MKIAYLLASTELSGGVKVVLQQAEELARRGHRVTIVSPDSRPGWFALERAAFEEAPFDLSRALVESDAAVATFWTTVAPAVAHGRGAIFHLCQGYEADFRAYAPSRDAILGAYRMPTRKLVLTPYLRDTLLREGHGDAEVIGQVFEAATFEAPRRPERFPLTILLPGIDEGGIKGVRDALAALASLREQGVKIRVLRVSAEPISNWEKELRITDEFHRAVAPDRMPFLYRRADVLVGPSHREEGFDLPVLEALASGLPAALSDTPAHRFTAGDAAVFFPPADPPAIERSLAFLLRDPAERERLAALGPGRAKRFRTCDVADRLESVFGAAIAHA